MNRRLIFATALLAGMVSGATAQQYSRQQQEAACSDDAFRLCGDVIPDEAKVTACMIKKKSALSPRCLVVFDAGSRR